MQRRCQVLYKPAVNFYYLLSAAKKGKEQRRTSKENNVFQANDENDDVFKRILKSLGYIFNDDRIYCNVGKFIFLLYLLAMKEIK